MTKLEKMGRAYALEKLLYDYTTCTNFDAFYMDLHEWVNSNNMILSASCFRGELTITIDAHRYYFTICGFEEFLDGFGFEETAHSFGTEELWATALDYFGIVVD